MGRTVPTFTDIIHNELSSWSKFRRGLRKKDQEAFDEMFRAAKQHLAENFYAMRTIPFESIIVSITLEQQKEIRRLERLIAALQSSPPKTGGQGPDSKKDRTSEDPDRQRMAV